VRLRTKVRRCEFGFPYALTQESVEGLTKEDICTPDTESASTVTITLPGAALFALVLAINLLGDGLRDVAAPRRDR